MSEPAVGRQIFEDLVEYPLPPPKAGVRDYVFYVETGERAYFREARKFFDIFYPNHAKRDASSLESLVANLHLDVTQGGIQKIRELVIVTHGTSTGLILPIFDGVTDTNSIKEYKYLTALSLAQLQVDIKADRFKPFSAKRATVVAHIDENSWVTIRACRFGLSRAGMYATYSFFGGRANVYAPKLFQFFGWQDLRNSTMFRNRAAAQRHLVMQRFIRDSLRTPERVDAVVDALLGRGQGSEPIDLVSTSLQNPHDDEEALYDSVLEDLRHRRINPAVRTKLQAADLGLSSAAKLLGFDAKHEQWTIQDVLSYEGKEFAVEHKLYEEASLAEDRMRLRAQTTLADAYTANPRIQYQLFLDEEAHAQFEGQLCVLAGWVDDPDIDVTLRKQAEDQFNAVLALLPSVVAPPAPLSAALLSKINDDDKFTLNNDLGPIPSSAKIALQAAGTSRKTWAIGGQYLVKLTHPASDTGAPAHMLAVHRARTKTEQFAYIASLGVLGTDSDTPGTELAAYLDRYTMDQLASFIDFLRAPLKPSHAFFIYQAQEAMWRKKGFRAWSVEHEFKRMPAEAFQSALARLTLPYSELERFEYEDKSSMAYPFDFNNAWGEVKASSPTTTPFDQDLFDVEDLRTQLHIPDNVIADRRSPDELDAPSPATDDEGLAEAEREGRERFFVTGDKSAFRDPSASQPLCPEFEAAVGKWQELQTLEPPALASALEELKNHDESSYLDVVIDVAKKYSSLRTLSKMAGLFNLIPKQWQKYVIPAPTTSYSITKEVVKYLAKSAVERGVDFQTTFLSRFAGRTGYLEGLLGVLEVLPAIEIPAKMLLQIAEDEADADLKWLARGKLTAIRQYLRAVIELTYLREDNFPRELEIDLFAPPASAVAPYYKSRYFDEELAAHPGQPYGFIEVIYSDQKLKEGYDAAAQQMPSVGTDLLRQADGGVSDVLQAMDLDACKVKALIDADLLDLGRLKALVVRDLSQQLLERTYGK